MKFSIIIPAYNEEKYLNMTLARLKGALDGAGNEFEIIVVDNDSEDKTAAIAEKHEVRIVNETVHNIARVRNTGAKAASGSILVFVDADTLVPQSLFPVIANAMRDKNCVGGAVAVDYGEFQRKWMNYYLFAWKFWEKFFNMKQGAAQFCRTEVFEKLNGYDEGIFVGEDIEFYWRMTKFARQNGGHVFFVNQPKVKTSPRRLDKMPFLKTFVLMNPIYIRILWRKKSFWKAWYDETIR